MRHIEPLTYSGRVSLQREQRGMEGMRVEALDPETDRVLGQAWTDAEGNFRIRLSFRTLATEDLNKTIQFRVSPHPERYVSRDISLDANGNHRVGLVIVPHKGRFTPIHLETLEQLYAQEKAILERISQIPNGGNLFLIHPFLLLGDVGVEVSPALRAQLEQLEPHLTTLSALPYQALKHSQDKQNVHIRVHGLFRRQS